LQPEIPDPPAGEKEQGTVRILIGAHWLLSFRLAAIQRPLPGNAFSRIIQLSVVFKDRIGSG
jgi:hypothetical protein